MESTVRRLYNYCLSLTKSVWQAEDLLHETLLNVYKVNSSEPECSPFLFSIQQQKTSLLMKKGEEEIPFI
ncbi:hypothetical protein FZC79_17965 [Rossellomorea vietnamensis]|uniref:RNA polymerase sigma-70 region 2 domain-containing protein n=1 Tax=Rossellomorea vietnamensis TaxID=218284 RepID=A0A5D4K800_9BACI|nr:hypothetical protein FZC79_17965 [Rossellomorea vietnamensis]